MTTHERSLEPIADADLGTLAALAVQDREEFFARNPRWGQLYGDRLLCVALCQGAGLHFVDRTTGVKDFDVWTFYAGHPTAPFPVRRRWTKDFGESRFGPDPFEPEQYRGRRVDLLARSIPCEVGANPVEALRQYLSTSATNTARLLAQKAVVLIDPRALRGVVAWPIREGG